VYCTRCGQRNDDASRFCATCGNHLDVQTATREPALPTPATSGSPLPGLKRTSVLLLILLTFVTVVIYYPVWFLRRRSALNGLRSRDKLKRGVFVVAIVLFSVGLLLMLMAWALEGFGEGLGRGELLAVSKGLEGFAQFLNLVAGIALLIQSFKVRRMLTEHVATHTGQPVSISGLGTFFFQILYLQYKINQVLVRSTGARAR
jgi:hypothetical protein